MRDGFSDNATTILIVTLLMGGLVLMFGFISVYYMNKNKIIAQSRDPIALACALEVNNSSGTIACMTYFLTFERE